MSVRVPEEVMVDDEVRVSGRVVSVFSCSTNNLGIDLLAEALAAEQQTEE